ELGGEGGAPAAGDPHPGARAAALVALFHPDQAGLLQHGQVPRQVAGGEAERAAQIAELGPRLRGDREDAEPVPLMNGVVEPVGRVRAGVPRLLVRVGHGAGRRRALRGHSGRPGTRSGASHAVARLVRCTRKAAQPATRRIAAGSRTFGRAASCQAKTLRPGFQPSLNTMFSMLYRLDSRAAPVETRAMTARARLRSGRASTHRPGARIQ